MFGENQGTGGRGILGYHPPEICVDFAKTALP
jgi:hypothetical protein